MESRLKQMFGSRDESGDRSLGTLAGVYRPTVLTILGVMLYLRQGWVVGNAGLLGGLGILLLAFVITGATSLSVSTITTNIHLGKGGAFALVSQSLGLEAGGAIGVPLYLAQALSAALYIYGFAEGWEYIFPSHPQALVVASVFVVGFIITLVNTTLALRLQSIVLLVLVAAVVSMIAGAGQVTELHRPEWIGGFQDGGFWRIFAVFFPAATGIMVGISMSGQLKDARRSIPRGIIGAWFTAFLVYGVLMVWYGMIASPEELRGNYLVSMKYAAWAPAVQAGLLCSCAAAMLGSLVAAPQILQALASHRLFPRAQAFTKESASGVYTNASLATGALVGLTLLLGDLDRIAALITMFFLITYATLNIVLLIEQSLALISFRPTLRVPPAVPLVGAVSCVFAMVITAPGFGLVALMVVVGIYMYLVNRQLDTPWETVRSGIFIALADWAAKKAQGLNQRFERAWKPDILVPVTQVAEVHGEYRFLRSLASPKGSLQILSLNVDGEVSDQDAKMLEEIALDFQGDDLFTTHASLDADSIVEGVALGAAVMEGSFFRPNLLYINARDRSEEEMQGLLDLARRHEMGCAIFVPHKHAAFGRERNVNVWVRDQSPNWELGLRLANIDLSLLLAYQLHRNWRARLRMVSIIEDEEGIDDALFHLRKVFRDARIPGREDAWVRSGKFSEMLSQAPKADIHIFGLAYRVNAEAMRGMTDTLGGSCLYILDSGYESAFA